MLPEEIPILFSNKHLYLNFNINKVKEVIDLCRLNESIPYNFSIPKTSDTKRNIGLLHPISQLQTFYYIAKYDTMITNFCKRSPFSVRSPVKRNLPKIEKKDLVEKSIKKINDEYNLTGYKPITTEEVTGYYNKYFSYNKFVSISGLYNSPEFTRDKLAFDYFLTLDIQNFFPSIYTHSLSWAIYGDKSLGKEYRHENTFANTTDKINQIINFNETNGLVVGPEFSRVIAEVLLTRIDLNLINGLNKINLKNNEDYKIYRYVDDYFIFGKQSENIKRIEIELQKQFQAYNLLQNVSKREIQTKPNIAGSSTITNLKSIFSVFDMKRDILFLELYDQYTNMIKKEETLGRKSYWTTLYENTKNLIVENPNDKSKLVKYFLRVITSKIPSEFNLNHKTKNILKQIIEIVSNIYVLSINPNHTNYLLQSYIKVYNFLRNNKNIDTSIKEEINEYMYQRLFYILKTNFDHLDSMYDIFIFMKMLNNKIPPYFLSKTLDANETNYFVLCSVAKYILNQNNSEADIGFKTVEKKLSKIIENYVFSYNTKGLKYNIYDGEYFYILNDFSKYPGLSNRLKGRLGSQLRKDIKSLNKSEERDTFELISKHSFYKWGDSSNTFIKKLIKKSSFLISKNTIY